jgi:RNA recognition motif-containing protein
MPNDEEANAAIKELNGSLVDGRNIVVNESTVERSFGRGEQRRI